MFRMYASNSHSYTHLILALGIVREPTIWVLITSEYLGIHDIGRANETQIMCNVFMPPGIQDETMARWVSLPGGAISFPLVGSQ